MKSVNRTTFFLLIGAIIALNGFSTAAPKKYAPPKDYGKINFTEFDSDNFASRRGRVTKRKKSQGQTREAVIFLLKGSPGESGITPVLVAVKRRVSAKSPLAGAMKVLLRGAKNNDGADIYGFIFGLKFVSAQIKNKTARIDFEYDKTDLEAGEDFSWGATMREFFPDAVEKTALQFEGVERVLVCVEGLKKYDSPDDFYHEKCPKNWWIR